jgi:hydroxypyruvate reductase
MKPRIVISALHTADVVARARSEFDAVVQEGPADMTAEEALDAITRHRAEGILFVNTLKFNEDFVSRLPDYMRVGATSSVGFDHVDVEAARRRGIIVTNTPDVLTECTADFTFMLLLAAARRASEYAEIMRNGWRRRIGQGEMLGVRVWGKTLGIIGLGRIGRAVAKRARGFDMKVLYHGRTRCPPEIEQGAEFCPSLEEMLPRCDFLSLHAPAGPATDRIVNARTLALLPRGAVLVNVGRGALVDEDALIAALRSGHLFAAGLDVFREEPHFRLEFNELPNVVLTPHVGSASVETRNAMGFRALDNIAAVLAGRPPIDPLWG